MSAGKRGRPIFVVVFLLLLTALTLRIIAVPFARFTTDERTFYEQAVTFAHAERSLSLYGPAVTGGNAHLPGPLFNLLTAAPFIFGRHPYIGGIFMAFLHTLAGLFFFLLLRRLVGAGAALFGLALFAVAPWDILYSDRLWASNLAPVWATALLYAASRGRDGTGWQATAFFLALTLPQIHLSAPVAWVAALVLFLSDRPVRIDPKALLIGILAAAFCYLPTMFDDMRNDFVNLRILFETPSSDVTAQDGPTTFFNSLITLVSFSSAEIGYHLSSGFWHDFCETRHYFFSDDFSRHLRLLPRIETALLLLSISLSAAALLAGSAAAFRAFIARDIDEPKHRLVWALIAGFSTSTLLVALGGRHFYPHYLNLLMPFALAPLALLLDGLRCRAGRTGAAAAILLFAAIAAAMSLSTHRFYATVDARNSLRSLIGIAGHLAAETKSFSLSFEGFDNGGQVAPLARHYLRKNLKLNSAAPRRFIVHNDKVPQRRPPGAPTFHGVHLTFWDSEAEQPFADGSVSKIFGGPGGTPQRVSCQRPARGLSISRRDGHVGSAALLCDGEAASTLGKPVSDPCELRCPDRSEFAGIHGRYGEFVAELGPLCRTGDRLSPLSAPGRNDEGTRFRYSCPPGWVIRRLLGAAGDLVDRVGVVCEKP